MKTPPEQAQLLRQLAINDGLRAKANELEAQIQTCYSSAGELEDGLYQVITPTFCAGFFVEGGAITKCAPILHKRINYWRTQGKLVWRPKSKAGNN
jgi:hypothetical protein